MKDPYGLLGVSRGASEEDVRKAYRRLARQYHPDANPGDVKAEERFKEIQQAYDILSNPNKRREYDERSRPTSRKRRPGSSRKGTRGSRKTTGSASGGRDGGREINWQLKVEGVEDIARISRILGMDITRLSKLAGEGIKRKTSSGKSGSADASGKKPSKPRIPPKPPKSRKHPDA